jgi:hypothetical protein
MPFALMIFDIMAYPVTVELWLGKAGASELKTDAIPYGRRAYIACGGELQLQKPFKSYP